MKKVVTINLNGRAYQVEEAGYEALQEYLNRAEKTLAKNPDKKEIIADIEQAIAEKCDGELTGGKNVVSAEGVQRVLEKIGPVHEESADDTDDATPPPSGDTPHKLYRLPKEGTIAGVCAGLAAYFRADVTIVRLLFVLLTFVTQGFMLLVYLALVIAMPEAKKPEEIAEAYGRPGTAREILHNVRETATDRSNILRIGSVITVVGRTIAAVFKVLFAIAFGALTMLWVWLMWSIFLGDFALDGSLAMLNGWQQLVFAAALYIAVAAPFFLLARASDRVARGATGGTNLKTTFIDGSMIALIGIAVVTVLAFCSTYAGEVRSYVQANNGYIHVGTHQVCVDDSRCGPEVQYRKDNAEN